ncbi:pyridoxamine 5'-phosphate oxidase family protein [Modestobacter sp. I12A-02662]|uniref:pyridoxamine 5'-phosphate oxidase family protein n=1 Tax=Modestobacter sp. I12A-02662 TaxID=1730496 RepID=UPI0034DE24F7
MTEPTPIRPGGEPTGRMREFLGRHRYLSLATRNPDASAHLVPVVYLFTDDRFLVATSSATRKVRNLAADPAVTVTVDDRTTIEWVSAVGTAELLTGPESRELNHRLYALWMTAEGLDVVGGLLHEVEDVTIVVTPDRWLAWSLESDVVPELSAAGIPMDDPSRWFTI